MAIDRLFLSWLCHTVSQFAQFGPKSDVLVPIFDVLFVKDRLS
jgi:hypothetical protein